VAASRATRHLAWEIDTAASRIHALVSAVKGFTRLDQAATPAPVPIAQSLRDTVAVLGSKARSKQITVSVKAPETLPEIVGVAGELNQVWSNLLDNALDAAPEGGQVEVSARPCTGGVEVCVVDNGAGIPADVQPRVFEPFFTTKPLGEGTGLGLDIARRLVRQHGGNIEFQTRPGRTAFRVTLPGTSST
jgi:signal transduction histidine kinase